MPAPLPRIDELSGVANEALHRQDWASLRFNAQLIQAEAPNHPSGWSFLGVALVQIGLEQPSKPLIQRGIECHLTAVRYGPDDQMALGNLALAWVKLAEYKNAIEILEKGTRLFPDGVELWGQRAQAELGLGRLDAADLSMRRALHLIDEHHTIVLPIDRLFLDDGVFDLANPPLIIGARRIDGGYACEEHDFDLYGTGAGFSEALVDLCEHFATLAGEYVFTKDPLDPGAKQLAERLGEYLAPRLSERLSERAS